MLEVAATTLRIIAGKNDKSRNELGRFLTKQVRDGGEVARRVSLAALSAGRAARRACLYLRVLLLMWGALPARRPAPVLLLLCVTWPPAPPGRGLAACLVRPPQWAWVRLFLPTPPLRPLDKC